MSASTCRICSAPLTRTFVDLGMSPLSNAYLSAEQLDRMEPFYPLHAFVCDRCLLVQLREYETPENIFTDYLYFSSFSDSWVEHARRYAVAMTQRFGLTSQSLVVELASNDGYLLQHFQAASIPILGVEPAQNVAQVAELAGITTVVDFFGVRLAQRLRDEGRQADLVVANNVLAHVPDLNDFVAGIPRILKPQGVWTVEFPHLLRLMQHNQFDTIYHEHFSYFSLLAVESALERHGLRVFDVEEMPTHGGSLRVFACLVNAAHARTHAVSALREMECEAGLHRVESYASFGERVEATKRGLLQFLIEARNAGKRVVGYGAPAKGNTLLNYCGIRQDLLDYTVDRSPHKQGRFLPGTHIPIFAPERIGETRPDYVLILPWNLRDEIMAQMAHAREWGARFVVPIPAVEVLP